MRDGAPPSAQWSASIALFNEQLQNLLGAEDLGLRAMAVKASADLYLIFRPATFKVCVSSLHADMVTCITWKAK